MNAPVVLSDASGLVETVRRAMALLDEGDLVAARELARRAYDAAADAAALARRLKAGRDLKEKADRLQGEALLIAARADIAIAEEVDAAQAAGLMSTGGRPSAQTVAAGNGFTAEDAGLNRKAIHDARRLRDAVAAEPSIVERAIAARLEMGLAPTRASLRAAIGTRTATKEERGLNLYETPDAATEALLAVEAFSRFVWEPACGRGAIARVLEAAGHEALLSDIEDRGCANRDGELQRVIDFMETKAGFWADQTMAGEPGGRIDIVTNPPYGADLDRFILHALVEHRPRKMACLLNLNWLAGCENEARLRIRELAPPSRVWVMTRRVPMMHRDGWDGDKASSQMNTMWAVWEADAVTGAYAARGETRVLWLDFKAPSPLVGEGRGGGCSPGNASPARRSGTALTPTLPHKGGGRSPAPLDAAKYAEAVAFARARKREPGATALARHLGCTRAQATEAIARMVKEGIVTGLAGERAQP